ncbi:MAG: hypothetical protein A3C93_00105 [Candidatus Lloydbacteria bacterium RIFCSPHIGHO2_02_FULL_54_17]|uniref:Uncharacterized protein n=1 Tax=Candidatus Lloydbacteria bacterium RIFCSPHIGHO2_02_FULL_54_17 TaxID=1798664 RepID=A0A1G2DIB4_9BACT|nr:MAG: hypothetical protein A2762_03855 [Candidatus Lloydbacteria bacterium RIFCSPHIGHO2_01_FULL_54_11]OGZ13306.1 MAG: hypothetical protein A3C93_00105 [Candidatus Lloydbacteria bacterium RIFCSPHIGHO2_02_FULL_54_17]
MKTSVRFSTCALFFFACVAGMTVATAGTPDTGPLVPFVNGVGVSQLPVDALRRGESSTSPAYVPPVYDQQEFQYFVDQSDKGNSANMRAELRQLLLAPKFVVRISSDGTNLEPLKRALSEKYKARVTDVPTVFVEQGIALFVLEFPADTKQERLVETLNAIVAQSGGAFEVIPVFYVENREAMASGVVVTFAAPFSGRQVEQMLRSYGGFRGLELKGDASGLRWTITPLSPRFTLESLLSKGGKARGGKFDVHLLTLANLLEAQKLLPGVPVVSARPMWNFMEEPLSAALSIEWPADTIGGTRVLRLTVTIIDHERVRFEPSKVTPLGSSGFELKFGSPENTVIPGWLKLAENGKITEKNQWIVAAPKNVVVGDRSFTVHTLSRPFYLLQPETAFSLSSLPVVYEHWDDVSRQWKRKTVSTNSLVVGVLPHRMSNNALSMPEPPSSQLPRMVEIFIAPPEVTRGVNDHWFSGWAERAKERNVSVGAIGTVSIAAFALAFILLTMSGFLFRQERRRMDAAKPVAVLFMSPEEFNGRMSRVTATENSVDGLSLQMVLGRKLVEDLLVARIPGIDHGHVTASSVKDAMSDLHGEDPRFANVLGAALELLRLTNAINAPKGSLDTEYLSGELEQLRSLLPAFYAELGALPPRMKKGEQYDTPVSGNV